MPQVEKFISVMLSAAKHLAVSVSYADEILRLSPRMTLRHSLDAGMKEGDLNQGMGVFDDG